MGGLIIDKQEINKYINYLFIAYAFSFPVSKAAVSLLEFVIFILWVYKGEWNYRYHLLKDNPLILSLSALIILSLISVFWASSLGYALDYISKYYHFLMIFIFYTALEKKYVTNILTAFLMSMLLSELLSYGIYFELFQFKNATVHMPTPFMHHVTYSVVLVFTSTILLSNIFSHEELKSKILSILFFITIVINLFINGGRTGQIVFIVLIATFFLMRIKDKLKAILIATIIIVSTFFIAYNFSNNFNQRVHQLEKGFNKAIYEKDYTDQGGMRISMIMIGTQTFFDNFVLGTGIGNVMKDANHYSTVNNYKTRDMNMFADFHNVFINISVQLGIFGLLIILSIFYSIFTLKIKTREYFILNRMFLIAFVLYSCTHNSIHVMNGMVFFALFAGLFNAIARLDKEEASVLS
ncbi:MAG: O-antigen ligase [Sulfurimonas sp.]|uniref:O-antigen ligase family protein n=1 Tax=Sulfurimonas sp. TaxID=2022749 RepID=UPI0039E3A5E1